MQLTVLGAYLPRMSPKRLTAWIADDVKEFVDGIRELQPGRVGNALPTPIELMSIPLPLCEAFGNHN